MDYAKLAAEFGGTPAESQQNKPMDYAALAAQFGGAPVQTPQPTETGGFFGSFGTALKERAATALPAAKMFTGLGDQKAATDEMLRAKKESEEAYKQTEFSEIGDAFKTGDYGGALSKTVDKFKEVAGSSFGSMAPAAAAGLGARVAAGAGAAALGAGALPAAAIGTAAFGLVTLGSYIADNLGRQKEELAKEGKKYEDINRLPATAAAMGQTALDVIGFKMFKPLGALVGMEGKEVAQKTAQEIIDAARKPGAYAKAVAKGTATGVAFEVPQEVTQQVLERWQAGLPLDPFSDPEAAKEYMEAAGGALLLGGPMGAYSGAKTTYDLRKEPEQPGWTKDLEEGKNVRQPITITGGEGTGVAGEPGAVTSTAGPGVAEPGGVVHPGSDVGVPAAGEGVAATSVDESQRDRWKQRADEGIENTSLKGTETVSTKYGVPDVGLPPSEEPAGLFADLETGANVTPATTVSPKATETSTAQSGKVADIGSFRELYDQLRTELWGLLGETRPTQQVSNQIAMAQRDLNRLVDDNKDLIGNAELIKQLKNPTYDGTKALTALEASAEPRAAQGNLFGSFIGATRRARAALALGLQDKKEALNQLRQSRDRIQKKLDSGGYDDNWAMQFGRGLGMTAGEAIKNRETLARNYATQAFAEIDDAISMLERSIRGPYAMQGDIFGKEQPKDVGTEKPESLTDVFGEPEKAPAKRAAPAPTTSAGVSTSPQERVVIYTSERDRISKALQAAQVKLAELTNQIKPADPKEIKTATDAVQALTRNLDSISRELAQAQADVDAGVTAPEIKQRKAEPKVSTQETEALFTPDFDLQQRSEQRAEQRKQAAAQLEEEFGAPIPGEVFADEETETAAPITTEKIEAPRVTTEHVAETREGEKIEEFFNLIESKSDSEEQVKKHQGLASSILDMLLEYDVVAPGEKSSPALGKIYDHLTSLFGGRAKFNELLTKLREGGAEVQSAAFKRLGVPDLTTYRGLTELQKELQTYLNELSSTGEGFKIATRSQQKLVGNLGETQAPLFPRAEETLPYTDDVNFLKSETRTYPDLNGEPRKPEIANIEQQYKLKDFKLRSAWSFLKQKIQMGRKGGRNAPSKEQLAAYNYLTNTNYDSFGQALNSLAQDLAYWHEYLERKYGMPIEQLNKIPEGQRVVVDKNAKPEVGEGTVFYGEGGRYAENFQKWIEGNLSDSTVRILNRLIERHRENIAEENKYAEADKVYNEREKKRAAERKEERRANKAREEAAKERRRASRKRAEEAVAAAEKAGTKAPKAPEYEDVDVAEETEEVQTPELGGPFKNQPILQMLPDVHNEAVTQLKAGNLNAVLRLMTSKAAAEVNKYYAALAQRLLDAKITAKSVVVGTDHIEPLSNDPAVQEQLATQLDALEQAALLTLPKDAQGDIIKDLKSKKLRSVYAAVSQLQKELRNDAHKQIAADTLALLDDQYGWSAKYNPVTDQIVFRQGYLTNGLVLHESLHAALSQLLDNPQNLQGARLTGYNQLKNLYEYATKVLGQEGFDKYSTYGLQDLHEFVSEALTNPEFQAMLRALRFKASPFSMMTSFVQAVKKLFGVKDGGESNVLIETIKAADVVMEGGISGVEAMEVKGEPRAMMATSRVVGKGKAPVYRPGRPNSPSAIKSLVTSNSWGSSKDAFRTVYRNAVGKAGPVLLGGLTMRQISDLVNNRIPQVGQFINIVERFVARKNSILRESGDISKRWAKLQGKDPDLSRLIGRVMHQATMLEVDPDKATLEQRNAHPDLMKDWAELKKNVNAVNIYRDVRDFYAKRYEEYKQVMENRIDQMRSFGVSENTILKLRNEFENNALKGPYFPLMRYGKYWYQVGKGATREYYMFENLGERDKHLEERLKKDRALRGTEIYGETYQEQAGQHVRESNFLREVFDAIDSADMNAVGIAGQDKQTLKDSVYQAYLSHQPDRSFRNQFIHRRNIAGYSEDALRNFASSSFHMAYQLARFENANDMYSRIEAAREQLKDRKRETGYTREMAKESNELEEYIGEMKRRLDLIMNPPDVGKAQQWLSNAGFIWYLTAPASAITNVLGGMMIGFPTLVGQYVKMYPNLSYTKATAAAMLQVGKSLGQIMSTGFKVDVEDKRVMFPTMDRNKDLTDAERIAYDRFTADGLIDITAAYDQSGLAAAPTEAYTGKSRRVMEALTGLFHNAERFNREIMAMSTFRAALAARKDYKDQNQAIEEAIAEAKDVTHRSMFDYSTQNKPRYFQHPVARVVLQFKQFPQQMTFFLVRNMVNMFKGQSPEIRREARARFVGTMGMAGIFSGVTGLWGFSTVAAIVNAVVNGMGDEDEEKEPFDFELEFANWAVETFGDNIGTMITRGIGNAAGVDIASRVKLDDMWFRDGRKNQDEAEALQGMIIELLGPTVGLMVNAAEAAKLWNEGHGDRAIETIAPALIKQPLVAARYEREGARTLQGEVMKEEFTPFQLAMQSIGLRPADLAELQFYNITVKGQEQEILKKRQNLMNLYGLAFMSNDDEAMETALDKIDRFNDNYPDVRIPMSSINDSVRERMKKSSQTDHGLYLDKKLRNVLDKYSYAKQ